MKITDFKHICTPDTAARMQDWVANRGGVALWRSKEITTCPTRSWSTPALTQEGKPYPTPDWRCGPPGTPPDAIIKDAKDICVVVDKQVDRILGVDLASMKAREARARHGEDAYLEHDMTADGYILVMAPESITPLNEWKA